MGWNSYLDSIVTRVAAISGVNRCERAANVDIERLSKIPRWPTVVITDMGGSLDPYSGSIYNKQFAVSIIAMVPRGPLGGEASKDIATVAEAIVTELTHTRDHGEITLYADIGETVEGSNSGEIYLQTFIFNYLVSA